MPWLRAAQVVNTQVANAQAPQRGPPFQSKGVARQPSNNPCFAYNRSLPCDRRRCRYRHKCRRCDAGHPLSQCSAPLRHKCRRCGAGHPVSQCSAPLRHKCRRCGAGHPVSQCSAPLRHKCRRCGANVQPLSDISVGGVAQAT